MVLNILILIAGLAVLIKGADLLVDGASSIAKKMHVPYIVIGLLVVAFGTSLPELIINIVASIQGSTALAVGNIIGSNLSNILLILGLAAIIYPLKLKTGTTWKEIPLSLLAVVILFLMLNDALIDSMPFSLLGRVDGLILLSFFIIFIYYTYGVSKIKENQEQDSIKTYKAWIAWGMVALGIVGLTLGGKLTVDSAVAIATMAGLSEAMIGLTIVAIGTSLPELLTSVVAAYKRQPDIAVGNIIGSNIFNIFWILGISSVINPIEYSSKFNFDVILVMVATLLLFIFMFIGERRTLQRWQGIGFVVIYVAYIVFTIWRG